MRICTTCNQSISRQLECEGERERVYAHVRAHICVHMSVHAHACAYMHAHVFCCDVSWYLRHSLSDFQIPLDLCPKWPWLNRLANVSVICMSGITHILFLWILYYGMINYVCLCTNKL